MIIDSHAHLNFEEFEGNWKEVADDCLANDIWVVNVGTQLETSKKAIAIAESYEKGMYASAALHPIHVEGSKFRPEKFVNEDYREVISSSKKVVAIGETGIDFFHNDNTFAKQKEVFLEHINLAKEFGLPLIMHGRDGKEGAKSSYQAILEILRKEKPKGGVIHCFGGRLEDARGFLELGYFVGFTGIVTFDKTGKLEEVVKGLPLDVILVETDSPYLAPAPYRGERNQPQYVKFVAEKIAEIKGVSYNKIAEQSVKNAKELFNF